MATTKEHFEAAAARGAANLARGAIAIASSVKWTTDPPAGQSLVGGGSDAADSAASLASWRGAAHYRAAHAERLLESLRRWYRTNREAKLAKIGSTDWREQDRGHCR